MSYQPEYFVAPRAPGVRPADPPDYDGITFVYLFANVMDPWIVPPQLQDVVLVVDNAQGFVSGMSIIIEGAGSFEVVSTDPLNRMTVENLGYVSNAAPGTSIAPGKITTTSLPGPKGDTGPIGPTGPGSTVTAGTTTTSPPGQNATVVNSGTPTAAIFNFTIPRGLDGPQGAQGPPGQAYSNTTTAAFTAAAPGTAQTLSLQSTTGLFAGVTLNINPIGYYQVTGVTSGTQVTVVNNGTPSNAAVGTVSPSGSPVLGTGPQGPPGISATLAAGNTTTIAPGSQAAVTARGTSSAQIFDFAIPAGVTGAQGPAGTNGAPGAPGAAATLNVGTTTTGAPGTPASVTASGTPSAQVFDFVVPQGAVGTVGATGPQGPPGTAGIPGPAGAAATITAGNTSTSAPGSNAAVTQRGTSSAAIFDFSIPRGDVGSQGIQGIQGIQGPPGIPWQGFMSKTAAYTLTTADSAKYILCSGGSWTLTLPVPALGLAFEVRNDMGITGTTGTITIQPNGGTIDGQASLALLPQQECTLITDGTNWRTRGLKREVILGTQDITSSTASAFVLLPSGYRFYELTWEGVVGSVDNNQLIMTISNDGGATFKTDANYGTMVVLNTSPTAVGATQPVATFSYLAPPATYSAVGGTVASHCYMKLWPGNGARLPHWKSEAWGYATSLPGVMAYLSGGHYVGGTIIVNAIRYSMASGNILSSQLTVKGVV